MIIGLAFLIGCLIGFAIGFLCYRNNKNRLGQAEKGVVDIAGKFKDLNNAK